MQIQVRQESDHDSLVTFDKDGTPFVQYGHHPIFGNGWTLHYLNDSASPTTGAGDYFIRGERRDVDRVLASARALLGHSAD